MKFYTIAVNCRIEHRNWKKCMTQQRALSSVDFGKVTWSMHYMQTMDVTSQHPSMRISVAKILRVACYAR